MGRFVLFFLWKMGVKMYLHQQSPLTWTVPSAFEESVSMETQWSHRRFLNRDSAIKTVTFPNGYISILQRLWLFNLNLLDRLQYDLLYSVFQKVLWSLCYKTVCTRFTEHYVMCDDNIYAATCLSKVTYDFWLVEGAEYQTLIVWVLLIWAWASTTYN